jgi:hypothetical protein
VSHRRTDRSKLRAAPAVVAITEEDEVISRCAVEAHLVPRVPRTFMLL